MSRNPWETLSKETKYDNAWIRIDENKVLNPSGNEGIYGVVHFKNVAVGIIPLDNEYHTWIVGQYRYPMESYEWEIPEGGSPEGETALETAKRELQEEVGIIAGQFIPILEMQLSNSTTDELSITYVARDLTFVPPTPEEDEVIEIRKLPFEDLFQMAMNGEIKDALSVASIFKVRQLIKKGAL